MNKRTLMRGTVLALAALVPLWPLGAAAHGIPFGSLGLITDPNEGERIVRDGYGDMVMMGRPMVTDPAAAQALIREPRELVGPR